MESADLLMECHDTPMSDVLFAIWPMAKRLLVSIEMELKENYLNNQSPITFLSLLVLSKECKTESSNYSSVRQHWDCTHFVTDGTLIFNTSLGVTVISRFREKRSKGTKCLRAHHLHYSQVENKMYIWMQTPINRRSSPTYKMYIAAAQLRQLFVLLPTKKWTRQSLEV